MTSTTCPFCNFDNPLLSNDLAYVRYDSFPVTNGHLLIIPYRHVADYFAATQQEKMAMLELLDRSKSLLDREKAPSGYNIGVNAGVAAGQTVMHAHLHLIPRYTGDVPDPRGGIRGVIPAKQKY